MDRLNRFDVSEEKGNLLTREALKKALADLRAGREVVRADPPSKPNPACNGCRLQDKTFTWMSEFKYPCVNCLRRPSLGLKDYYEAEEDHAAVHFDDPGAASGVLDGVECEE